MVAHHRYVLGVIVLVVFRRRFSIDAPPIHAVVLLRVTAAPDLALSTDFLHIDRVLSIDGVSIEC